MANNGPFIVCDNLTKIYHTDQVETAALAGLDLEARAGEVLAIVGPSGSGKSTLLNILGGLDQPSSGTANVGGVDLLALPADALVRYRRDVVGFVWQNTARNLLPYLTAFQNVCLPMKLKGLPRKEIQARARELLAAVEMEPRANHRTRELSGGEQQRVAIAVALANSPGLLLADEPTGSVDKQTAGLIIDIFRGLDHRFGVTVVIVTHDPSIALHVDRTLAIYDGRTSFERIRQVAGGQLSHEEFIMIDNQGRMQLPPDLLDQFGLRGRVRLEKCGDHLEIWPVEETGNQA